MRVLAGKEIRVTGIVQGVGFRPFVHGLARACRLGGDVSNDPRGVRIRVFGAPDAIDRFLQKLAASPPPRAMVARIETKEIRPERRDGFEILPSRADGKPVAAIAPDAAICPACRREMANPSDRRFGYPFTNCTLCGPRYSILERIPYDRANTAMRDFAMCADCQREYLSPEDRRHHAQANCCPRCGPRLWLADAGGKTLAGDPVEASARALSEGRILAVKGLGGFHLACDASNDAAVRRLRERKDREEKPFAVMARDVETVRRLVLLPPYAERLLASPEAPILIARKRRPALLAESVAPGNNSYGVMLPYTPLHALLLERGPACLVMTSGNRADEPIAAENGEALERLQGIADLFLLHDRRITVRQDDSVLLAAKGRPVMVRRSRGYAPAGIETGADVDGVAAYGAMLKNAPAVGRGSTLFPGRHVGDLGNARALEMFLEVLGHLKEILGVRVRRVACDLHPDYPSTRLAEESGLEVVRVQHHHAHLLSLMAESRLHEPAIGVALDGTGYGPDGALWGGEIFAFDPHGFERKYHLAYVPLPGGERAVQEPWRMALAYLKQCGLDWRPWIREERAPEVAALIESRVPMFRTSSMGRLFDAVSSLCGLCHVAGHEAQAPMALEGALEGTPDAYAFGIEGEEICADGVIRSVVRDREQGVPAGIVSGRFHNAVVEMVLACARRLREEEGLNRLFLSGGVFMNRYLCDRIPERATREGFEVLTHSLLPPNDGGIAAGQALYAAFH
ncbi:MAG: carbamoyltransferase HypF [Planctomycetota bacterium]